MAFNKLVDVGNKKENQSDFNFTAQQAASNDPAWPGRGRPAKNFISERRADTSVPGVGLLLCISDATCLQGAPAAHLSSQL